MLKSKDILNDDHFRQTLLASNISALTLAVLMCPFDVIATRLYNQGNVSIINSHFIITHLP